MSATKDKKGGKVSLMPRWAWVAILVLVVVGIVVAGTRETRLRARAARMLNETEVRLVAQRDNKPILDSDHPFYGHVVVMSNNRSYDKILGYCSTKTERAVQVFRSVMRSGTWKGKALACHMAFYLAQEEALTREDLDAMIGLLSDRHEGLRRVAQQEIGYLLVVSKSEKLKKELEEIGAAPPGVKRRFAAQIVDISMPVPIDRDKWQGVSWSCPEACRAWWKMHGAKVKWDSQIRRFAVTR